jgi:DNA-binding NarL/FixJ family response regulator
MSSSPFSVHSRSPEVTKVLIIDDHAAIIEMMTGVVESIEGFTVIGSALDPETAVEICRKQAVDVIILDLVLPRMSGLSLLDELTSLRPNAGVLIFTGNLNQAAMKGALAAGVLGVVEKMAPLSVFRAALKSVAVGQIYFGPLAGQLIKDLVSRNSPPSLTNVPLSKKEKLVLSHVAQGFSSKEIAEKMGLSVHTVVNHRSRLMKKTGLRRVAQLSLYAAQAGLIGETTA